MSESSSSLEARVKKLEETVRELEYICAGAAARLGIVKEEEEDESKSSK